MENYMSIAGMFAGVEAAKNAVELAKSLKNSVPTLTQAEMNYKVAELLCVITEVKTEMHNLAEENRDLKAKLKLKEELVFQAPFYFSMTDATKVRPYCQKCFEVDGKAISLYLQSENYYQCKECDSYYDSSDKHDNIFSRSDIED